MASGGRRSTNRRPKGDKDENADKAQAKRFKETARALEVDESGDMFERTFRKVVPAKRASGAFNKRSES